MKLFDTNPNFVRLDDDVSFQILRTNPNLTTNTKLMYDGTNLYLESYSANALLSTNTYKNYQVYKTGLFNRDLRNFLLKSGSSAYLLGQKMSDTIIGDSFDYQFENMYWCGAESINSAKYPQELGFIAPLYLRKKRPDYFVIFKIDTPANTNLNKTLNEISHQYEYKDADYDFESDIKNKAKIIKSFDLREGTPLGDYINKYVSQKDFKYDQSVYVNFAAKQIYYYGIDKNQGVLTQKTESISEQMLENDYCILRTDDWISNGFERNNLIFPYILNLEFLFDDTETDEMHFARYFGMYCNATDLYDLEITGFQESTINDVSANSILTSWDNSFETSDFDESCFYYVKDKNNSIFSIDNRLRVYGDINKDDFMGYESSSVSTYCEKIDGAGYATMIIKINELLEGGDKVYLYCNDADTIESSEDTKDMVQFIASSKLEAGTYKDQYFSCNGSIAETASALADAIENYDEGGYMWAGSYSDDSKVVIKATHIGSDMNGLFSIGFDKNVSKFNKITQLTSTFDGGTDEDGLIFKVYTSDSDMFFDNSGTDRDPYRYIRCYNGRTNAKILKVLPYINEDNEVDETYSTIITDYNGKYVNVSKTKMIEMIDKYYAKLGILSFFPVRDFDFDTVKSQYGEDTLMKNEITSLDNYLKAGNKFGELKDVTLTFNIDIPENEDEDDFTISVDKTSNEFASLGSIQNKTTSISYNRFYFNGERIENEYEYYYENILPTLTTVNKTVPFITKWGYIDDEKDSCENPYRLNTSKIFDTCNFSANTFMQKGDIHEYTHSMPYYVINDLYDMDDETCRNSYQYIINPNDCEFTDPINDWINMFSTRKTSDSTVDPFDKMFGDISSSSFTNKRFNKKYSRFLLGDDINRASTLFRGVKFEIVNYEKGKEVKTSKYNGYKFSFIYIPITDKSLLIDKTTGEYIYNKVHFIKNDDFEFIVGLVFFYTYGETALSEIGGFNMAYVYSGCLGFDFSDSDEDSDSEYDELANIFNKMTINNIKTNINSEDNTYVEFKDITDDYNTSYTVKIVDPDTVSTYDIFTTIPVMMKDGDKSVIGSVDISLKQDVNDIVLKLINRYSGYYNPIFKDILFYNNYNDDCKFSNTSFDYEYSDYYGQFGIINNLWYHKINETKSNEIINTLTPYYPMTGQYALSYKDYNIFSSSWDINYYTRQLDATTVETCKNIPSMKNGLCMFGSKYINVPEKIEIECLSGCEEWDDDKITNSSGYNNEVMYKEVNNSNVDFYFFLHKRILRYFYENLKSEFEKYVNPEYSYGTTDSLEDDINEYTEKNILKLYQLDKIRVFVKRKKMGVHNNKIENDYTAYLDKTVYELKKDEFTEIKNVSISKVSTDNFDRQLVYNLRTGEKESFGFSFVIKKI